MMTKEDWEKGLTAWENIKKQAEIDIEQADLFIEKIKERLESLKNSIPYVE